MTDQFSDCYDHPRWWNRAFADETRPEADFIRAAADRYCDFPVRSILEPACGGGRQVVELARRGFDVTAFDLNATAVGFTRRALRRRKLAAEVFVADMCRFTEFLPNTADTRFDVAHCFVNSFRHLTTETAAAEHLNSVARVLRPGGLYLLGLHLLPPDAVEYDCERWTLQHRRTRLTTTFRVLNFDRRRRLEIVRFSLRVRSPRQDLRLRSDHTLRIYRADQMRSLLKKVPDLRLRDVFDFCYDIQEPLRLDDRLGDAVLVLQKPIQST